MISSINAMDNTTNMVPKLMRNASFENKNGKRITMDMVNVDQLFDDSNAIMNQQTERNSMVRSTFEESKANFSAFENSMSDSEESDNTSVSAASARTSSAASSLPEFRAADQPVKYMTAADFEKRVCNQLAKISASYDKTAERYEKAIAQTEKTMKVCEHGIQKIDRFNRIQTKNLNEGFRKIAVVLAKEMEGAAQQWYTTH